MSFRLTRELLLADLHQAYLDARRHKRKKSYQQHFERHAEANLQHLCDLPLTRTAIIAIIVLYSLCALAGGWACVLDLFASAQQHVRWLQFISSVIPAFLVWCYYPGLKSK